MVTLYVHLREQIAKRLHHGLSKTILMNTLTDVREFKKTVVYCVRENNDQSITWQVVTVTLGQDLFGIQVYRLHQNVGCTVNIIIIHFW